MAQGLRKAFGDYPVLRSLDLKVEWGKLVVVFGANGSGKTTLMRLLSTQYRPDAGEIWVAGRARSKNPSAIRRIIGVVAHQPMLYDEMTCAENLLFFGRMHSVKDLAQRIDSVLGQVGLDALRNRRVRTLSHGMQKRLAFGRAILHDPPILLMDEPESGLDQEAMDTMGELVRQRAEDGGAVVMTTHNVDMGLAWADEVAVLSGGRIALQAPRQGLDVASFRSTYLRKMEVVA